MSIFYANLIFLRIHILKTKKSLHTNHNNDTFTSVDSLCKFFGILASNPVKIISTANKHRYNYSKSVRKESDVTKQNKMQYGSFQVRL